MKLVDCAGRILQMAEAIAQAMGVSVEYVYRVAGMLPSQAKSHVAKQIEHLTDQLPPEEQSGLVEYIKMRIKLQKGKGKNEK